MKKFIFVASALVASPLAAQTSGGTMSGSGAGLAERGATEVQPAETTPAQPGDRRICRRVETASGSRMAYRRMCMTADQWRNFNRAS